MMEKADRILLLTSGLISCLDAGILTWRTIAEEFPLHAARRNSTWTERYYLSRAWNRASSSTEGE